MDVDVQAQAPLTQLPHTLLHAILLRLPADERSRVATVCRTLRDVVANPVLWTEVDLTRCGVTCSLINPSLIVLALAPRLAALRVLRLQAWPETREQAAVVLDALNAVLVLKRGGFIPSLSEVAVAGALQSRIAYGTYPTARLEVLRALLTEAPALTRLDVTEPWCESEDALALLTLPGLRMRTLRWVVRSGTPVPPPLVLDVLAAAEQHVSLQGIMLPSDTARMLERSSLIPRLVDVAVARRLTSLSMSGVRTAMVPHLARLLRESTSLRSLSICGRSLFEEHNAAVFATALRANATLQELVLRHVGMWHAPFEASGIAVCAALEGHPSVTSLTFDEVYWDVDGMEHFRMLDVSLDALLRANAPALTTLDVRVTTQELGTSLPRMFGALPHNTHLRTLRLRELDSDAAHLRNTMLPGVRGNTSLRELQLSCQDEPATDARYAIAEAKQLVEARAGLAAL